MANKSYASSEVGDQDLNPDDPEYAKDFQSAYAKVRGLISPNLFLIVS